MKKSIIFLIVLSVAFNACKKDRESNSSYADVYIINQGIFGSSTAEISGYNPDEERVTNQLFRSANPNAELGDVAQSSYIIDDELYVAVNNSHKIEVLDAVTLVRKRVIVLPEGNYPRYMVDGAENELVVTNLYNPNVLRINRETGEIVDSIKVGYDSEGIVKANNQLYITLPGSWPEYHNQVAVVDLSDYSIEYVNVGVNPTRVAVDNQQLVWVLCIGTWGAANASLYAINSVTNEVVHSASLSGSPADFALNVSANELYVDNGSKLQVYNVSSKSMKTDSIQRGGFYDIAYSALENKIYAVDPLDYTQNGLLFIYGTDGSKINSDTLRVGVIPGYIQIQ
ncbi:hypothetical protein EP331_09075 [bacterium]|nr:MAG: hypothetical protein EP331_09075 [bacterium]